MNLLPGPYYPADYLVNVGRELMQQRSHELVVVQRPVEPHGETVRNGGVPYVEAGFPDLSEDVGTNVGVSLGGLVVDGVGVDEGDGEALGC